MLYVKEFKHTTFDLMKINISECYPIKACFIQTYTSDPFRKEQSWMENVKMHVGKESGCRYQH
jgi:hypothetical protein